MKAHTRDDHTRDDGVMICGQCGYVHPLYTARETGGDMPGLVEQSAYNRGYAAGKRDGDLMMLGEITRLTSEVHLWRTFAKEVHETVKAGPVPTRSGGGSWAWNGTLLAERLRAIFVRYMKS